MALLVYLHKETETATEVRYRFHADGSPTRYLILDKQSETILPDDGNTDPIFRAAATKLATTWLRTGQAPGRLVYSA